jgi:hypothetical protein
MKQMEMNAIFNRPNHELTMERHHQRLSMITKSIDNEMSDTYRGLALKSPRYVISKQGLMILIMF